MSRRILLVTLMTLLVPAAAAQATLRVFIGSTLRPDVIGPILEQFSVESGVATRLELGGATTDVRQQYLSTVLTSRSGEIDVFLFDVIDPPQYAAAGWAEPLNDYFASEAEMEAFLDPYLDGTVQANLVDGTLYGIPAWTDAQFLYYRADLLEEYGFEPPTTWAELKEQALTIQQGEGDPDLQGFNYQGAAIEGANCTFLEPLWSAGGDWRDSEGNITVDSPEGRTVLEWYQDTLESGITPANIAEVATDDSRQQFQAGDVVFMLNWGYAWAHFQGEESQVRGRVGVAPLPAFEGGESATCVGGFQWAMNPFGRNKAEAFELMKYMASEESQRALAVEASHIPARESLYGDSVVLEAAPHFEQFHQVIVNARPRPQTEFYSEVSELIRTTMNAFLAQAMDIDEALDTMQTGLEDIFAAQ
jgi:multiple sugar transport system substrate-binding protein